MSYHFTVSPDFTPEKISGWFIFNTWLQRRINEAIHLDMYDSFQQQRDAIAADKVDLIYANPYDASMLVREKGFLPVARPRGRSDEAIVAVRADSPVQRVDDLKPGVRVVLTDDPDVDMMGMIILEAADLHGGNTVRSTTDTYVLVAKKLLKGEADVGIFGRGIRRAVGVDPRRSAHLGQEPDQRRPAHAPGRAEVPPAPGGHDGGAGRCQG